MPSSSTIRRQNVVDLFQRFAEDKIAAGEQPKGLEGLFAAHLEVSGAMWSMVKSGARPVGDKLARQIERRCQVPAGWLDEEREPQGLSQAEQQFLALALKVYRQATSSGKKQLRALLKDANR